MGEIEDSRKTAYQVRMEIDEYEKSMGAMGDLGLLRKRGEGGVKEEQEIPGPPMCAIAAPPPTPPSTFLRDKPRKEQKLGSIDEGTTTVGTEKGKWGKPKGSKAKEIAKRERS